MTILALNLVILLLFDMNLISLFEIIYNIIDKGHTLPYMVSSGSSQDTHDNFDLP